MGGFIDLTGRTFGRLSVLQRSPSVKGRTYWLVRCDCGNEKAIESYALLTGHTSSCGCLRSEVSSQRTKTHGCTGTRLHKLWLGMLNRCTNPNNHTYDRYGGNGVTVCDEWLQFETFKQWAIESGYLDDLSIDRIDPAKGYSPSNCRWADRLVQSANRRQPKSSVSPLGASFDHKSGKWRAQIQVNKVNKRLGYFDTAIEAAMARNEYIIANGLPHTLWEGCNG